MTFRWKDYRHGSAVRLMTLSAEEFLRRFCLHVLPKGFVRIRFYGFLAPRCRTEALPRCRQALGANPAPGRRPPSTIRPPVCPCRRVLPAVGSWSLSNDSPYANSPCRSGSRDSRLILHEPDSVDILEPPRPGPIRRRVSAVIRRRHRRLDHRASRCPVWQLDTRQPQSGSGTAPHQRARTGPLTIQRPY